MNTYGKKRTNNFTEAEVNVLVDLVKKYSDIIECKKSDTVTNADKASAWQKITNLFNSKFGNKHRDQKILKTKYDNLKKITKKKYASIKLHLRGTGLGPPTIAVMTATEKDIQELLGSQVTGLISEFDNDAEDNCKQRIPSQFLI
ncbi:hypothetical protein ABEB36_009376 [Hypothenemus hampei]|uniref:Regulatory protein zeste n=1 Tax=Hypothenemus hampei TaxID=57062 RepID=A0ABD1EGM9_HYPHA